MMGLAFVWIFLFLISYWRLILEVLIFYCVVFLTITSTTFALNMIFLFFLSYFNIRFYFVIVNSNLKVILFVRLKLESFHCFKWMFFLLDLLLLVLPCLRNFMETHCILLLNLSVFVEYIILVWTIVIWVILVILLIVFRKNWFYRNLLLIMILSLGFFLWFSTKIIFMRFKTICFWREHFTSGFEIKFIRCS